MEQGRTELEHDIDICCEKKFQTYDEFIELLEKRRQKLGERWVKTSGGRTVEAANRVLKNKEKFFKAEFKYQYVNFICIHGGIYRSQATERNTGTMKLKCPVHVQLSANRKENTLVVKKVMLVHNHELVPHSTQLYALDRRATNEEVMEITKLRKLGISASKIIAHMAQSSGKVFKRDDIHNIIRRSKKTPSSVENEVDPKFLNSNATSKTRALIAIPELIDHNYDPHVNSKTVEINRKLCLTVKDDGSGMDENELTKMLRKKPRKRKDLGAGVGVGTSFKKLSIRWWGNILDSTLPTASGLLSTPLPTSSSSSVAHVSPLPEVNVRLRKKPRKRKNVSHDPSEISSTSISGDDDALQPKQAHLTAKNDPQDAVDKIVAYFKKKQGVTKLTTSTNQTDSLTPFHHNVYELLRLLIDPNLGSVESIETIVINTLEILRPLTA